jgi:hypothetical protein
VGDLDDGYFCHCSQCRKNYGLYGAFVGVARSTFVMTKSAKLQSFKSSKSTTRTFCGACGAGIAWDRKGYDRIHVLTGTIDGPIKPRPGRHIHTKDRGRYYRIPK